MPNVGARNEATLMSHQIHRKGEAAYFQFMRELGLRHQNDVSRWVCSIP